MAILNGYATLQEIKNDKVITSSDAFDDRVIESLIENVSRVIDDLTGRWFYPRIQTRHFDAPELALDLRLNADLLSITSITNGDATAVTTAQYVTRPRDDTPYWLIRLLPSSSISWQPTDDGDVDSAISIVGVWGYHDRYDQAWRSMTTISAAITTTTATTVTMALGNVEVGHIIKIDSEYMLVTALDSLSATVERGFNGSTAATHLINATVYAWRPQAQINQACRMTVNTIYHNRFGNNPTGQVNITAAGVVITPSDIPASALKIIDHLARRGY